MYKLLLSVSIVFLTVFSSCEGVLNVDVVGDGNQVVQERTLPPFSDILLDAGFEVELKSGSVQSVEVLCDLNLSSYVITQVKDGLLSIGRKPNFDLFPRQPIIVKVVAPVISSVEVLGGGNVVADTIVNENMMLTVLGVSSFSGRYINSTLMDIFAEGSSRIKVKGDFRKLKVRQKGSGEVLISGEGKTLDLLLEGSGKIDADAFKVSFAGVRINGSGLVFCHVSEILDAVIKGNGRIYYYGSPLTLKEDITGEGLLISGE